MVDRLIAVLVVAVLGQGCAVRAVLPRSQLPRLRDLGERDSVELRAVDGERVRIRRNTRLTLHVAGWESFTVVPYDVGFGLDSLRLEDVDRRPVIPYDRITRVEASLPSPYRHLAWVIPTTVGLALLIALMVALSQAPGWSGWS